MDNAVYTTLYNHSEWKRAKEWTNEKKKEGVKITSRTIYYVQS